MRWMKLVVALTAAVGISLLGISGCGGGDKPQAGGDKIKIGFIVKQPEESWFQLEWKFAEQAAKEDNFELIKIGAPDPDKVQSAINSLRVNGAQGFVICTPETTFGPTIMQLAQEKGLKVIAVDDRFVDKDNKPMPDVVYLGISARKIGQNVGHALAAEMKKRGWAVEDTALCAVTYKELETARERTDGAVEAVKQDVPNIRVFEAAQQKSDLPHAQDAMTAMLTQQPGVKHWLICGMNDAAVMGAVRATEAKGIKAADVIGVGINGTECIGEFEAANPTGFFASILLSARQHGHDTADMLYHWIKDNKEPPKETLTEGRLINRDNYKTVLKEEGIRE